MNTNDKSIAVVMLHGDCDMHCTFCITDNHVETMTRSDYAGALTRLRCSGFANLVIGGGEPFCWPEGVGTAARMAKAAGFYVQVGTNGVRMPDHDVHGDCVDRYVVPLDAHDAETHNSMRRMPGNDNNHHGLILRRLEQFRQWRRSVTVSTVVSRANLDRIVSVGDLLADYVADGGRLHAWHLYCFIPRGRGGSKAAGTLGIYPTEFNEAVNQARRQHYPYLIYKRPDMRHSATVDFFWRQKGRLCAGSEVWEREMSGKLLVPCFELAGNKSIVDNG